ncbi:MAG: hypothetical protein KAY11_19095, partial [Ilumatobacteraceae bacterium]|nr:hypothetical protein [Ilumatobacteraceae bacterium]MBP8211678.1 hypothetical protein [Ilumatobacteraceae bacterium]
MSEHDTSMDIAGGDDGVDSSVIPGDRVDDGVVDGQRAQSGRDEVDIGARGEQIRDRSALTDTADE